MTDHEEIVPAPASSEAPPKGRWQRMLEELEQDRDELRVRLHLGRKEAQDELDHLDARLAEFRARARAAGGEAEESLDDIGDAAKALWTEVKEGFGRVRKSLKD